MSKLLQKIFRFNQFIRDQRMEEQAKKAPHGAGALAAGAMPKRTYDVKKCCPWDD